MLVALVRWRSPLFAVMGLAAGLAAVAWVAVLLAAEAKPTPEWLWAAKEAKPNEVVFFRKSFDLASQPKKARLTVAADDRATIFVNGKHIAEHVSWEQASQENVADKLTPGKNVVAVRGINGPGGPAAVIVHLEIELADGSRQSVVSDASWKCTTEMVKGWQQIALDDAAWKPATSLGKLGVAPWTATNFAPGGVDLPKRGLATPIDRITTLPGFKVELVYEVPKGQQGSWVSMTADPQGRLICSDQGGSLYRVTPGQDVESTRVEKIELNIGQAQGLLYAFDRLYVMINGGAAQGSGLYYIHDTDGDDKYDEVVLLKKLNGGGEHGPHAIRLGPDGKSLFIIAGNHTNLPEGIAADSPTFGWGEDHLLQRNPDGNGHATGRMAPGGWVIKTDKDAQHLTLFCAGFRNQYDIAFNQEGELFSYDADMEWDTGTPWYRATRVNHCVSGAEFGWRYGTGKWPAYYIDSLGAITDIGLGSPTGIEFGAGAKFPAKYQRALFINDWTYGKIYAVHPTPLGAGYTATFETFISGKPLPVTDICVNPVDRALYFTIGGRGTQSAMYRVTYDGPDATAPVGPAENPVAAKARATRHQLEAFHGRADAQAIATAWPYLNSADRNLRFAARVAVESQPAAEWAAKALAETRPTASLQALCALCRVGDAKDPALLGKVLARLNQLPFAQLTEEQLLDACRVYQLAFIRLGRPEAELPRRHLDAPKPPRLNPQWPSETQAAAKEAEARLNALYPHASNLVNRELEQVLVYLESPAVIAKTLELLKSASNQQDQMHFVFVLRNLASGWTPEQRRVCFAWINLAEGTYRGGASFKKFCQQIRNDFLAKMTPEEKESLKEVIEGRAKVDVVKLETTRQFQHNWQMDDLLPSLAQVESGRSFEKGRVAYEAAQCYKCHRFKGEGGDTGPDITGVGNRFKADYLLEAVIDPSRVISDQYMNFVIETNDGEVITGRVINETADEIFVRTDPFAREPRKVKKSDIASRTPSKVSEMPQGLINVLTREEILDLIAYLRSGGDASDKAFGQ